MLAFCDSAGLHSDISDVYSLSAAQQRHKVSLVVLNRTKVSVRSTYTQVELEYDN